MIIEYDLILFWPHEDHPTPETYFLLLLHLLLLIILLLLLVVIILLLLRLSRTCSVTATWLSSLVGEIPHTHTLLREETTFLNYV